MSQKTANPNQLSAQEKHELARSINDLNLATGANADEVINNWQTKARSSGSDTYAVISNVVPVIQSFAAKIAEMRFENRGKAYKGKIRGVLDAMYDSDLVYGHGREYSLPNYLPVRNLDVSKFVPDEVTNTVNTVSTIVIDQPKQVNLTLQSDLYRGIVNNGGNLARFVDSLKSSLYASLDCYLDNRIIDDFVLAKTTSTATSSLTEGQGVLNAPTDKVSKFTDATSQNMKECLNKVSLFIQRMTSQATDYFNIEGTDTKGFYASDFDSIKILCTNKFYQNMVYGMTLGLFKPELLNPIFDKLVPVPEFKVSTPTQTNQSATSVQWTNKLDDNTLVLIDQNHSFVFGKQFMNVGTQYYDQNMALQITLNYLPYFGNLKDGRMMVYTCAKLNTLPGNVMANV